MGTGDLLVELLGEHVDAEREALRVLPEGNLGKDLVGERAGHDEGGVTSGASEVDETTLGEEDDVTAALHGVAVDLGLDLDSGDSVGLEPGNVDLDVEVANVADNGILGHDLKVLACDDVAVTSGGDEDVGPGSSILHGGDLVASHGSLEGVDGVDLGDENAGTIGAEGLSALERD